METPVDRINPEALRLRRFELATRLNELHAEALADSQAHNFKKGDIVFRVSVSHPRYVNDNTQVTCRALTLTSIGKRQGTATRIEDGKNTLVRVYRNHDILLATRAEVQDYAKKVGPIATAEAHLGSAYCLLVNRPNLLPAYVAKCDAEVAARLAAVDAATYTVVFV